MSNLSTTVNDVARRLRAIAVSLIIVVCSICSSIQAAEPQPPVSDANVGTIKGVVIYESDRNRSWRYRRYYVADRKKGHLAEAVVCLVGEALAKQPNGDKPQAWKVDQLDFRFIPETIAVRKGDEIEFTNSDPLLHDVTTKQRQKVGSDVFQWDSFSLPQNQDVTRVFRDAGGTDRPITLSCRFHSAMRGWIYVFDHSFFQVTGEEGTFRLENVPAGKHRVVMIHSAGNLRAEQMVEVQAGQTQRIEIRVSPDDLVAIEE